MSRYFGAVVLLRLHEGLPQVLLIDYVKNGGHKQVKVPGGKSTGEETPEATARREFPAETGLLPEGLEEVFRVEKTPDHEQVFFLATAFGGEMRTEALNDGDGEVLSAPYWRTLDNGLVRSLFPTHRTPVISGIRLMAQRHESWGWAIRHLDLNL